MNPTHDDDLRRDRTATIATLYAAHATCLERRVAARTTTDPQTIEDACSFAWTQLLAVPSVDLAGPEHRLLGWLTVTATREAWRLAAQRALDRPLDHDAIEVLQLAVGELAEPADVIAARRARLALVASVPQRPRRFLLRRALGYSHLEIAASEHATATTISKQLARARRTLDSVASGGPPPPPARTPAVHGAQPIAA